MRPRILCVAAMFCVASVAMAQATVFDAYTEFSSTSNTSTDTWQYLSVQDGTSNFANLPLYSTFPYQSYNGWNTGNDFPAVGASGGEIKMQPNIPYGAAIAWKSSEAATADVSFLVHDVDVGPSTSGDPTDGSYDGVNYYLYQVDATPSLLASGYVANAGSSGPIDVDGLSVSSGTVLCLLIDDGTVNHWYDTIGVSFTVTTITPEPTTSVMLIGGLLGLMAYAWRKRK